MPPQVQASAESD